MQSIMVGISGLRLTDKEQEVLKHPLVGGVILFARNYESPAQLSALTDSIHQLRSPRLLIAVDQEGGRVQRFKNGFTLLPAPKRCGEAYAKSPAAGLRLAEACGELMAIELLSCGVDLSFAPVLDIDDGRSKVIGDRAFHHDPIIAGELGQAFITGARKAGMQTVGKHFPGHGSVINDTHVDVALDPRPWEEIAKTDLLPFQAAIANGIGGMMIAHVIYQAIDSVPAGFSKRCVSEILRQQLGFKGAIFSDDMGMLAAKHFGSATAGAEAAFAAGCDMVLFCNEPDVADQVLATLTTAPDPARLTRIHKMFPSKAGVAFAKLSENLTWCRLQEEIQKST